MAKRTTITRRSQAAAALALAATAPAVMANTTAAAPAITSVPSAAAIGDIHTVFLGDRHPSDQVLVASIVSRDAGMTEYLVRCDPFAGVFTMNRYDDHIAAAPPASTAQSEVSMEDAEPAEMLGHRQHHHHNREGADAGFGAGRCDSAGLTWVTMWPSEGRYQWTAKEPGSHKRQRTCTAKEIQHQEEAQHAATERDVPVSKVNEEEQVTLVMSCSWNEDSKEAVADGARSNDVATYTMSAASFTSKFFAAVSVTALPSADSEEVGELKKRASSASNCPSPPPATPAAVTGGSPVSGGSGDSGSSPTSGSAAPTRSPNVGRTVAVPTTDGPGMVVAAAAVGVGAFVFGWGLL